ncbi:metallophosphoesterase [uncultured Desulfovibrio sp.]|uniref:metallophosphoesterase n=1 Tax=uncultured Desulfovibrio sp. TaxID=167968 RepID=UPI0003B4E434|nr:metallophosphoesterase [uncultured Desulfovibrio sp.]
MLYLSALVLFLYLFFRMVLLSGLSRAGKAAAGTALFLASQEYLLNGIFFGGLSAPSLPSWVLMLQGWLFTSMLFLFALTLIRDIACLGVRIIHWAGRVLLRKKRQGPAVSSGRRRFLALGLAAAPASVLGRASLAGLVLAPTAYGVREAVAVPEVRQREVVLPRLPEALDGLRLAQISDLHVSPLLGRDWVRAVVDRVNAQAADVVVLTGDMVDGLPSARAESVAELRRLRARHGVLACAGNHEYYSGFNAWTEIFSDLGMSMLLNSHQVLGICGHELVLAGVTDPVAARFNLPEPDLAAALAGAPDGAVRVLLDHRPGNAARNARNKTDLQLSGHTHGGHAPGLSSVVALFNKGYVRGWYRVAGMPLYVSSGAGLWNGFPLRVGVPSEIALITLRCAAVRLA